MPLKRCSSEGKSGWKYGNSGHCYTGPGAKKKAIKQGLAEQYNGGETFQTDAEIQIDVHDASDVYRDDEFTDKEFSDVATLAGYTRDEVEWALGLRHIKASSTKTFEVKYEKDGKTITTSISARNSSEARKYIKNQHPDAKIIDVYEI